MTIGNRKIVVLQRDSQTKPDVGRSQLAAAFGDDKVDIAIGPTSSGTALAMLPVAEEYKKILLVEPAVADSITGDKWNRYIFRTGRNSMQDAVSNAVAVGKPNTYIATLAQDYAFGKDFVDRLQGGDRRHRRADRARGIRPGSAPPTSPPRPSASSTRSRTSRAARSCSSTGPARIRFPS